MKLSEVAYKLNIEPDWLDTLIRFESNWNINAKNPKSSARGLLQFTDSTAQSLGYLNSLDLVQKNNTVDKQLDLVYKYLKRYAPFDTITSLYMSVFFPKYKNFPENTKFPQYVQDVNPGIVTIEDYMKKVFSYSGKYYINRITGFFIVSIGGYLLWKITKKKM